jgi:hypothetical protein
VLLDMDLPSWADEIITSIGDAASMDQLSAALQQIGAIQTTFTNLGKAIEGFAGMTDSAFAALMRASGGIDALSANANTYYENFYSEAEKTANVTKSVSDALAAVGLEMPKTRAEFRALVDSQMALQQGTGDMSVAIQAIYDQGLDPEREQQAIDRVFASSNALQDGATTAVAALLGVSGAFAQLQDAASALRTALRTALGSAFDQLAQSLDSMHGDVSKADKRVADARMEIWSGYADAQQRVIDLEMQAAEATRGFAQSLRGFVSDLATGPGSSMGLESRYRALQQQLQQTAAQAGAGDQGARDSLTGVASSYLDASRNRSRTSVDYARDEARVRVMLGNMATVAESDPLVQKYDAESLTIQQQIADAQVDVVKYLALMEATGTSTDLGIQTVDKTLAQLRDEYVGATQAQALANLKLDVALAALDALGLTEELVKAIADNQTNSLSAALNITDEALASITGALGLTPENVSELGQQFAVEVALLVGQAATDLAATLQGALAFDPSQYDVLRGVLGYDPAIIAPLATALGLSPEAVQQLASQITLQDGAAELLARVADGLPLSPDAAQALQAAAEGVGLSAGASDLLGAMRAGLGLGAHATDALAAGVGLTAGASEQLGALAGGIGLAPESAALLARDMVFGVDVGADVIASLASSLGISPDAAHALASSIALQDGSAELLRSVADGLPLTADAAQALQAAAEGVGLTADATDVLQALRAGLGLAPTSADALHALNAGIALEAVTAEQVNGLNAGIGLNASAAAQVQGLLGGLMLTPAASDQVQGLLDGIKLAAADRATIERMLGGIVLEPAAAAALSAGLGVQAGLLPMLGTALGLSADAAAAIASLSATAGAPRGFSGAGYFEKNADVAQAWANNEAGARDQFADPETFALYHYLKYGKQEMRSFAVGTSYVPQDMVAQIHRGEEITPRPYVDAQAADRQQTNALLARLVQSNAELKAELAEIKRSSQTTASGMTGIVNKQVTLVTEAV